MELGAGRDRHPPVDHPLIDDRDAEALKAKVKDFSPEAMSEVVGVAPHVLRDVARIYATSKASIIFWGMGISQHTHGTDNARCLIDLALMCGQVGRPGTGLHPLRGQNNVQGASDAGLIPMSFPDYHPTLETATRHRLEDLWEAELDPTPGLTVVLPSRRHRAGELLWRAVVDWPYPTVFFEHKLLADRMGVMHDGTLLQWDRGYALYHRPANRHQFAGPE